MADATYQPKVYRKQGGDEEVVASGGAVTVESGGGVTVQSGGTITGQSGGKFDAQSGFNFYLADASAFSSDKMKYTLYSLNTRTHWGASGSLFSGGSIITPGYGYHFYSAGTGVSKASLQLPSAYVGARLVLDFSFCGLSVSIFAESGGGFVSLYNYASVRLSSLETSAAGRVELICFTTDVWSIVESKDGITENAAA